MQNTDEVRKALMSLGLCHILDCMGYSPQMVDLRRRQYSNFDCIMQHIYDRSKNEHFPRSVGSKAEGGSRPFESDHDNLHICKSVVCVEASVLKYTGSLSNLNSIYTMVPCLYHPGHFKLLLIREGFPSSMTKYMQACLNPFDSGHWLSSKEFLKQAKDLCQRADTTAGPAVCCNKPGLFDQDMTYTIPCICPTILGNWIKRDRKYSWPPSEVIQQISQMNGNLVATGIKGCFEEEIEWRLCFNEVELLLVENWNETEAKLYTFLKMIKKDILKLGHEITSYIIKNIVFWLSERYPQTNFRPDNLFSWIIKALRLLKRAVKEFLLPYYMIPERNLIAEKLQKHRRKDIIKQINNVISLGPQLFWNCKKTAMAMAMSLPELQLYKQKRDEFEWLWLLLLQDTLLKCEYLGFTDSEWMTNDYKIALEMRRRELMLSPWPSVVQKQLSECSTTDDMLGLLLK